MLLARTLVLAPGAGARGLCSSAARCDKAAQHVRALARDALPRGYAVSATYAGIKAAISPKLTAPGAPSPAAPAATTPPKPDLALVVSAYPAAIAGVFTQNVFQAAPVQVGAASVASGAPARAVLVNSGCANAVTGERGLADVRRLTAEVSRHLSPAPALAKGKRGASGAGETLMMSTGVIGVPLPLGTIERALPHLTSGMVLRNDPEAWAETSRAFMTTDTFPKLRARQFSLAGHECRLVGISKGAGMIHPRMGPPAALHATLLSIVATDAPVEKHALQKALNYAVSRSFNSISVDGDMSTNDTVLALANGAVDREAPLLTDADPDFAVFQEELTALCLELAHLLVRDGEGATKFVRVNVTGAPTREQAHAIASSISTSALVKTALHGADANWGRILCAAGYAPIPPFTALGTAPKTGEAPWAIDPTKVTVTFLPPAGVEAESLRVLTNGVPQPVNEDQAAALLAHEDIVIRVDLQDGPAQADFWTCDLSKEYVSINGDYRS